MIRIPLSTDRSPLLVIGAVAIVVAAMAALVLLAVDAGMGAAGLGFLVVLIAFALGFGAVSALAAWRRMAEDVEGMKAAQLELRHELGRARDEAKAILTAIESSNQVRRTGPSGDMNAVLSEVRVLQNLVEQLSTRARRDASLEAVQAATRRAVRVVHSNVGAPPAALDVGAADLAISAKAPTPAPAMDDQATLEVVREALRVNRVDLWIQPVVSLPQRKRRHYECFSRIRLPDGAIMSPGQYLAIAEREGLISAVDNMLLFRSVQLVRRLQRQRNREVGVFVNISEHTLADAAFFREFAAFMAENRDLAPNLVFEFMQAHVGRLGGMVMLELERLARLGFRFSMDQVSELPIDCEDLNRRHFRYVRLEAQRLLQAIRAPEHPLDMAAFRRAAHRNNIDLIVEKIEDEATLLELLDLPVDFGQGFLFGEPRPARDL
jgi:cyclic-di-GMP phosphodiesterase TipF (flagellum assembly factor)